MKDLSKADPVAVCPVCGSQILDAGEHYLCEKSQADKTPCRFKVSKAILHQAISREQLRKLASDGRTDLLTQFITISGRPFAAFLVLDENRKIAFEFAPNRNPKIPARVDTIMQPPQNTAPPPAAPPPPAPPGFEEAHTEWTRLGCSNSPLSPRPDYYETTYWKLVKAAVLERDGHKCFRCQSVATVVHHLNYDFVGTEHLHSECLVSVCKRCHRLVEHARHAESLADRISRRISLCEGFVKDQASYKDQNPVHIYARLLEYQDELEELRRLFRGNVHYSNPRFKTKAEREAVSVSVRFELRNKAYHEKAGAIVSHWEGTEIEKSRRLLSMLALEMENCRKFVAEVFAPVSPNSASPLPPTSPSALPTGESLVVGIKFHRGHVDGIRPGDAVQLVREPNNTYDRNAVRINLDSGETLGYLTREFAAKVARQLDAGGSFQAQVSTILADKCQIGLLVRRV